jgi:sigma-54 dependent transcriptional regulator, acetoin dehydrogenase operon transcriptional activator AcoR
MVANDSNEIDKSIATFQPDYRLITRANDRAIKNYKVDPEDSRPPHVLTSSNLKDHLEPMKPLLDVARFGTEYLFNQVKGAGYVLLLTDAQGVTVDFFNNQLVDQELKKAGLFLGSCWAEEREGTCAVGVALAEKTAVTVHKDEHYRIINKGLTCSSSPIFAPNGDLLAILDASALQSPDDKRSQYLILEMVKSTSRMIENANFLRVNEQNIIIRISNRHEFLEVSTEGLIALNHDGFILSANQYLFRLLGTNPSNLIGKHIDSIFDTTIDRILKAARYEREPISLRPWTSNNLFFACISLPKAKKISKWHY